MRPTQINFHFFSKKACMPSNSHVYCARTSTTEVQTKARSGSSVWLERSPVTAEVAGSSPVRFVTTKKDSPTGYPFLLSARPGSPPRARQVTLVYQAVTDEVRKHSVLPSDKPSRHFCSGTACLAGGLEGGRGFYLWRVSPICHTLALLIAQRVILFCCLRSLALPRNLAFRGASVGEAYSMMMEEVFAEAFCCRDFTGVAG